LTKAPTVVALIVAAGRGTRAQSARPKQYVPLAGAPVLAHTALAFLQHPEIDRVMIVLNRDDHALYTQEVAPLLAVSGTPVSTCIGGETRNISVKNGLLALENTGVSTVLIHDAARPLISAELISRVLARTVEGGAAAPALTLSDTLWRGRDAQVTGAADRTGLFRAQTPQGFDFASILSAHNRLTAPATDDVEVARRANLPVAIVAGDPDNIKITTPGDFARAARLIRQKTGSPMDIRSGNGFDVHAFCPGDHVTLCGVRISHRQGLLGHSDADVALHAITDAIYGALAEGDIGQWFPPGDPRWKGAESAVFLHHATTLSADKGYRINNVDCTIICESPKIGPHVDAMRDRLAGIMAVPRTRLSVKATTTERLGFAGRGEGIAALANVILIKSGEG